MLATTGTRHVDHMGASSSTTALSPTFWRPMELRRPAGVSTSRGWGLPRRGCKVMPLLTMAPRASRSKRRRNSMPFPKHPEATMMGLARIRLLLPFPPISTWSRISLTSISRRKKETIKKGRHQDGPARDALSHQRAMAISPLAPSAREKPSSSSSATGRLITVSEEGGSSPQ